MFHGFNSSCNFSIYSSMSESRLKCLFQYLHFWNKINSIPLTDYFYTFKNYAGTRKKLWFLPSLEKAKTRYIHTHTLQKALKFPSRHRKIQSVFVKEMAFIINLYLKSKGMFTSNGKWSSWKCFTGPPLQLMIHHRIFSLEIWSYCSHVSVPIMEWINTLNYLGSEKHTTSPETYGK